MKCSNCGKPISGLYHQRTVDKHINGTVNRYRTVKITNCSDCQKQIEADMKASKDQYEAELSALKMSLGLSQADTTSR